MVQKVLIDGCLQTVLITGKQRDDLLESLFQEELNEFLDENISNLLSQLVLLGNEIKVKID